MAGDRASSATYGRGAAYAPAGMGAWAERPHTAQMKPRLRRANAGPRRGDDPCPDVAYAGARPVNETENARHYIQPDLFDDDRPSTPEKARRYRRDFRAPVGQHAIPRGQEDLPLHKPLQVNGLGYGRPSRKSESVGAVMQACQSTRGVRSFQEQQAEAVYESSRKEPLGKAYLRGHQLPVGVRDPGFGGFGQPSAGGQHASHQQGKETISPPEVQPEPAEVHDQYVKTHQAFEPGEQLNRRYAWPTEVKADPFHAFGRPDGARSKDGAGVKGTFAAEADLIGDPSRGDETSGRPDEGTPCMQSTRIVPRAAEDCRRVTQHPVGRRCDRGEPPVPAGYAYGVPSVREANRESVAELMFGGARPEDLMPDKDLGRSIKEGRRNVTSETRAFGKPSVERPARSASASAPERPSMGFRPPPRRPVHQGEVDAGSAIAPGRFLAKGIDVDDFSRPRGPDEVAILLKGAGYNLSPDEFLRVWDVAVRAAGAGFTEEVSLNDVIKAYSAQTVEVPAFLVRPPPHPAGAQSAACGSDRGLGILGIGMQPRDGSRLGAPPRRMAFT